MISRLSIAAACFSVLASASLTYAAGMHVAAAPAAHVRVVQLDPVVIVAKRAPLSPR